MKKLIVTFLLTLFCAVASFAQSTTVSGTVTDAGSQAWANGKYTFTFQPNPQFPTGPYTWTGGTLNNVITGTLDGSGHYSVSIPSNSAITPAGSTWILQVTPDATSQSFSTPRTTITGGTQTLNVTPPVILISWAIPPGPAISAYTDSEIGGPLPKGAEYFNVTSGMTRVWNGTAWNNQGSGGGGSGCPNGAANDIQSTDGTNCVGDPSFTWNGSTKSLLVFGNGTTSQTLICGDNGAGFPGCISGLSIDDIGNQVTVGDNEAGGTTVVEGDAEAQVISNTVVALTAPTITGTSTLQTSISTGNNSVVTDHINGVSITAAGASANTIAEVSTLGAITRSAPTITDAVGTASPVTPGSVLQRSVTTTTDTILSSDRGNRVVYNSASAVATTLPPNGSAGFDGGFNTRLSNQNAGTVTVTPASGTINGNANLAILEGQNCFVTPSSTGTNYAADCNEPQITAGAGITITRAVHGITVASSGGGISGLTTGVIPQAGSSTTIVNSSPQLDNGLTTANVLTYAGTGGITSTSYQNLTGTAAEQYSQQGRVGIGIAVPFFRPSNTNTAIAFDISPNGTPSDFSSNTGVSWIDVCSIDCTGTGVTNYESLRAGKFSGATHSGAAHLSAAAGGTGTTRNLILQLNGAGVGVGAPPSTLEVAASTTLTSWGNAAVATPTLGAVTASPLYEFVATYQNSGTPTFAPDVWAVASTIGAGTNGTTTLNITHTSGSSGTEAVMFPAVASVNMGSFVLSTTTLKGGASNTNLVYQGGSDTASTATGTATFRSPDVTGGSTGGTNGSATLRGGNNASSSASAIAGDAIVQGGGASAGGKQGHAKVLEPLTTNAAITAHMIVCGTTTGYQVAACPLGAVNIVGEGETVGGTGTQILVGFSGEFTVVFDGTPTIGDVACGPPTGTGTIGLAHDNALVSCTAGTTIGVIIGDVSGTGSGATATVLLFK